LGLAGYSIWPLQLACDVLAGHEPGVPALVLLRWYVDGGEIPVEALQYNGGSPLSRKCFDWGRSAIENGELPGGRQDIEGETFWWAYRVPLMRWGWHIIRRVVPDADRPPLLRDRKMLRRLGWDPLAGLGPLFTAPVQQPLRPPVVIMQGPVQALPATPEPPPAAQDDTPADAPEAAGGGRVSLSDDEQLLLEALHQERPSCLSATALAARAGLTERAAKKARESLGTRTPPLVASVSTRKGWGLTAAGLAAAEQLASKKAAARRH